MRPLTLIRLLVGAAVIASALSARPVEARTSDLDVVMAAMLALAAEGVPVPTVLYVPESPEPAVMGALACYEGAKSVPHNFQEYCPDGYTGAIVYGPFYSQYWFEHVIAHESYHLAHQVPAAGNDPFREREATAYACSIRPHVYLCKGE